jgi:gliding motility-associated protein GldM
LDYEASVFFSAVDTTQNPTVTVGNYKTTQNADGSVKYEMTGDFSTLPVDATGKGVYRARAGNPGPRSFSGLITMKAPNGEVLSKPFRGDYVVGVQNVVISATAMNMLYRGIPNPIDILVPGVGPDKVRVSMRNGNISKGQVRNYRGEIFPGTWVAEPETNPPSATAQIAVSAEINGKQQQFKPMEFRVKDIPTPQAQFANITGQGTVTKADLLIQQGVLAVLKDFDFDLRFTVTEFALSYDERGLAVNATSKSNRISDEQKAILSRLTKGKTLYVQDIKATGPGKKEFSLSPIIIKVN